MIVEDKRYKEVLFSEIRIGDVFERCDAYYMRIADMNLDDGTTANAVEIESGYLTHIYDSYLVAPLKSKLIVEGDEA